MSAPNGQGNEVHSPAVGPPPAMPERLAVLPIPAERLKELVAALEIPFDPGEIDWRVMNATKNQQPARGQVVPYADQRAYTDRLNSLVTPAGWTRKYTIHTSANFERSKDQKLVAKVLVACELTIFGLGSHSATGEEWADDDNAGTSAEAQAFKRACSCFGLGRYLYYFEIISRASGLIWTNESGQRPFPNFRNGRRLRAGWQGFARADWLNIARRKPGLAQEQTIPLWHLR